jgi:hypothetical protein
LEQDAVRYGDLADVVKRRCLAQPADLHPGQPEPRSDLGGEDADALGVLEGAVVAVLDSDGEQLQGFGAGVVELVRSFCDLALERLCAVGELLAGFALRFERGFLVTEDFGLEPRATIDEQAEQRAERDEGDAAVEVARAQREDAEEQRGRNCDRGCDPQPGPSGARHTMPAHGLCYALWAHSSNRYSAMLDERTSAGSRR